MLIIVAVNFRLRPSTLIKHIKANTTSFILLTTSSVSIKNSTELLTESLKSVDKFVSNDSDSFFYFSESNSLFDVIILSENNKKIPLTLYEDIKSDDELPFSLKFDNKNKDLVNNRDKTKSDGVSHFHHFISSFNFL
jgi:hypothetical protein